MMQVGISRGMDKILSLFSFISFHYKFKYLSLWLMSLKVHKSLMLHLDIVALFGACMEYTAC